MNFLHSLFVLDTFIAIPSIGLAQIFWLVELSKAVVDANIVLVFLRITGSEFAVFVVLCLVQHRVKRPTALGIKLDY